MTDKLKPCPHCEQIPKRHIFEDGSGFITCKCDKLTGGTTIFANWRRPDGKITKRRKEVSAFSEHEADIIWNSRPIEDALKARIAELEAALDKAAHELYGCTGSCPSDLYDWEHPNTCVRECDRYDNPDEAWKCWRLWLLGKPRTPDAGTVCDAQNPKSATQQDLPVSGATQKEVDK